MKSNSITKKTGTVIPLGALYDDKHTVIGEYPVLADFALFCQKAGLGIIQLLPVNDTGTQSSPYSGLSAFALHPIYICITDLPEFSPRYKIDKTFAEQYENFIASFPYKNRYNYQGILNAKTALLRSLYETTPIAKQKKPSAELSAWIKKNQWIIDYAVYKNLKWKYMQSSWKNWPEKDCRPDKNEITARWNNPADKKEHLFYAWVQMRADEQFSIAAQAVKEAGIILKGDMPILMNEDSCDVWAEPLLFRQNLRAGSPADKENPTGQNWGFPIYNWDAIKADNYSWWKTRLSNAAHYYRAYRLDHVIGFFRIWAVPERDTDALLGHTEPFCAITQKKLTDAGFDKGRIIWLSQPHVPTGIIQNITWNYDSAHNIMKKLLEKLPNEELWRFKTEIRGEMDITEADFGTLCNDETAARVKKELCSYWHNRCLIDIADGNFIPLWTYRDSTAWVSLSNEEKEKLQTLIDEAADAQEAKWKEQADDIFTVFTSSVPMIPCGEDLGANPSCLPDILEKHHILGLRVIRWTREWNRQGQPYIPFKEYTPLSVTTTSVHDSPTLRQWWTDDKIAAAGFITANPEAFSSTAAADMKQPQLFNADPEIEKLTSFTPVVAEAILSAAAHSASVWCIYPLQDFLYLVSTYLLTNAAEERINIPGTVTDFNWTYRLPVSLKTLLADTLLIDKIKKIAVLHDRGEKK
jgi:4-alpha-glucanotransferase